MTPRVLLADASIEQLEQELARKRTKPPRIAPLKNLNFTKLIEIVEEVTERRANGDYSEDDNSDDEHWIYEAAVEAVYGDDYFPWLAQVTK